MVKHQDTDLTKMDCSRAILLSLGLVAIAAATVASQESWMSFYTRFVLYCLLCSWSNWSWFDCWFRQENCEVALNKGDDGDRRPEPDLNFPPGMAVEAFKVSFHLYFQYCPKSFMVFFWLISCLLVTAWTAGTPRLHLSVQRRECDRDSQARPRGQSEVRVLRRQGALRKVRRVQGEGR